MIERRTLRLFSFPIHGPAKKTPFHKAGGEHIEFLVPAHCTSSGQMRKMLLLGAQKNTVSLLLFFSTTRSLCSLFSQPRQTHACALKTKGGNQLRHFRVPELLAELHLFYSPPLLRGTSKAGHELFNHWDEPLSYLELRHKAVCGLWIPLDD